MAAARVPQDRRKKASATLDVTVRGVPMSIKADVLDDFDLMFDMQTIDQHETDAESLAALIDVFARLAGVKQARALIAAVRKETGHIGIQDGVGLINEFFEGLKEAGAPNS